MRGRGLWGGGEYVEPYAATAIHRTWSAVGSSNVPTRRTVQLWVAGGFFDDMVAEAGSWGWPGFGLSHRHGESGNPDADPIVHVTHAHSVVAHCERVQATLTMEGNRARTEKMRAAKHDLTTVSASPSPPPFRTR